MPESTSKPASRRRFLKLAAATSLDLVISACRPPRKEHIISTMLRYEMPVYVTELDVNLKDVAGTEEERYRTQAHVHREVMEACLKSEACTSISFWDQGDRYAWGEWPADSERTTSDADTTLFDDDLDPKPAYYAVRGVLAQD